MSSSPAFALSLPARPESLTVIRHVLGGIAETWPVDRELLDDIRIAVTEACGHVVMHVGDGAATKGMLEVRGDLDDGQVVMVVRDHGQGDTEHAGAPGLGLGLPLIGALTTRLEVGHASDGVHEVRMTFPRAQP
jgi:serine/threonine-protein kinase RsbW